MTKRAKQKLPETYNTLVKNFEPLNSSQELFVKLIEDKQITIATGVPGSGKTFVALATGLNMLGDIYKKVILVKSVVTLPDEAIGYLKGDLSEKMAPHMMSFTYNIDKLCGKDSSKKLMEKDLIEVLPLAFVRGITLDNCIVIIDESQNFTSHIFKSIITRIGNNSKYIFLGDVEQIDRKKKEESCLHTVMNIFKDIPYIGVMNFSDSDCIRNPIIPEILQILRNNNF